MKKLLLIGLIAFSTFSVVNAARLVGGSPIGVGPTGPVYVHNYWGKFGYESIGGQYSYIKIVGGNTLQACQQAYYSALGQIQTSSVWTFTGHILHCQSH